MVCRALEPDPGGHPLQRRWTGEKAVVVIPVKGKVLKFVAWIDHPDGDANPPQVVVRADSRVIHDGPLTRSAPLFIDIPATPGKAHMVIETSIDRLTDPRMQAAAIDANWDCRSAILRGSDARCPSR